MKLVGVVLIAFALFLQSDLTCAAPQAQMTMSANMCDDMAGSENKHSHKRDEIAGNCVTCLLAPMTMPTHHASFLMSKLPFDFQTELQLDEFGAEPPIPPPRLKSGIRVSIF